MSESRGSKLLLAGTTVAYLLIGFEVLIMITPFTLYFYSAFGPFFETLERNPATAWLVEFFLPHMVYVDNPLIKGLSYLQFLMVIGLVLFFLAAIPLYYGRFTGKGVVRFGFYARIRHPQYLFLALSGLGLLLYWPRFIILILYVTMLFVYYALARNEEWRMKHEQPGFYDAYMENTWMFIPGDPGGKLFNWLFGWLQPRWVALCTCYGLSLGLALGLGFTLRSYTIASLPSTQDGGTTLVSVYERPAKDMDELYRTSLADPRVQAEVEKFGDMGLVYLMPGDYFLTGLMLDEGPRFSAPVLKRYPELARWKERNFQGGLRKFFRLFYKFIDTWSYFRTVYDFERVVFFRVTDSRGRPVTSAPFALGNQRTPLFLVDLDFETHEVLDVVPLSGNNLWGSLPMPAF